MNHSSFSGHASVNTTASPVPPGIIPVGCSMACYIWRFRIQADGRKRFSNDQFDNQSLPLATGHSMNLEITTWTATPIKQTMIHLVLQHSSAWGHQFNLKDRMFNNRSQWINFPPVCSMLNYWSNCIPSIGHHKEIAHLVAFRRIETSREDASVALPWTIF